MNCEFLARTGTIGARCDIFVAAVHRLEPRERRRIGSVRDQAAKFNLPQPASRPIDRVAYRPCGLPI
jgi:hypothetical protein